MLAEVELQGTGGGEMVGSGQMGESRVRGGGEGGVLACWTEGVYK